MTAAALALPIVATLAGLAWGVAEFALIRRDGARHEARMRALGARGSR